MTTGEKSFLLGAGLATCLLVGLQKWRDVGNAEEIGRWREKYEQAKQQVRIDSVRVVETVTRTKTLRDSVLRFKTDTQLVERLVHRVDTLEQRCLACTASASVVIHTVDTLRIVEGRNNRRWTDRLGISGGYGFQLQKSGTGTHGWQIGATIRVWP